MATYNVNDKVINTTSQEVLVKTQKLGDFVDGVLDRFAPNTLIRSVKLFTVTAPSGANTVRFGNADNSTYYGAATDVNAISDGTITDLTANFPVKLVSGDDLTMSITVTGSDDGENYLMIEYVVVGEGMRTHGHI